MECEPGGVAVCTTMLLLLHLGPVLAMRLGHGIAPHHDITAFPSIRHVRIIPIAITPLAPILPTILEDCIVLTNMLLAITPLLRYSSVGPLGGGPRAPQGRELIYNLNFIIMITQTQNNIDKILY